MDRFGLTGKISEKRVHLLRWTTFPGRTVWNFGWMDRASSSMLTSSSIVNVYRQVSEKNGCSVLQIFFKKQMSSVELSSCCSCYVFSQYGSPILLRETSVMLRHFVFTAKTTQLIPHSVDRQNLGIWSCGWAVAPKYSVPAIKTFRLFRLGKSVLSSGKLDLGLVSAGSWL